MSGPYINDPGYEVSENTILTIPFANRDKDTYKEIVHPLKGNAKREWFTPHFYYCLPLNI